MEVKEKMRYRGKPQPLTEEALSELREKIKQDPKLIAEFVDDFEKALASHGFFMPEELQQEIIREAEKKAKKAMESLPARHKKLHKKIERGESLRIKVRIDRQKKTKEIEVS